MATNLTNNNGNPNETQSTPMRPKSGDGTVMEDRQSTQANWHGASQRPQEEYINDGVDARVEYPERRDTRNMTGDATPAPSAPEDIFPSGGPEAQSDG